MSPKSRQAAHDLRVAFDLPPIQPHKLENSRIDDTTATAIYRHMYRTTPNGTHRRHACLTQAGVWCWQNALERPQDISWYLRRKLRRH